MPMGRPYLTLSEMVDLRILPGEYPAGLPVRVILTLARVSKSRMGPAAGLLSTVTATLCDRVWTRSWMIKPYCCASFPAAWRAHKLLTLTGWRDVTPPIFGIARQSDGSGND